MADLSKPWKMLDQNTRGDTANSQLSPPTILVRVGPVVDVGIQMQSAHETVRELLEGQIAPVG
ncbi:hypothetical protein FS749_001387 [Ceratobasidium sp. UAMH 11750]|nr:hypothetical protein FS749_001387 [Ceratobasidium sp. UAMH 11750]